MSKTFGKIAGIVALMVGAVGSAHAAPQTFKVDTWHTLTTFSVDHQGTSINTGKFPTKEGGFMVMDTEAKKGSVALTIDVAGVVTGVSLFDEHLRSDKWLNTAKFPTATFKSSNFEFQDGKVSAVHGDLTFMGVTEPVALKASRFNCYDSNIFKAKVCGGDFQTTIKPTDFGMTLPLDVKLTIQVEGILQADTK